MRYLSFLYKYKRTTGFFITCCAFLFFIASKEKEIIATELDGLKLPEGFTIERAVDPSMLSYPMFASFDGQGGLFVFESDGSPPTNQEMLKNPPNHIRLLEDSDGDGIFDKSKIFADSLTFPKGSVFYNDSLYVSSSPDLIRLTDTDNDGVADTREGILTGWVLNSKGGMRSALMHWDEGGVFPKSGPVIEQDKFKMTGGSYDILEAILYPGASFAREFETSKVITKSATHLGVIKKHFPDAITIEIGPGIIVRVQRSEITGIEPMSLSMMPPGLDKQLNSEELSDLMAYLNSLPDGLERSEQRIKHFIKII